MAVGRIQVNAGKKGKGKPHYSYIMAQDRYTKKKVELVYSKSDNMPDWAIDNPKLFWQMADDCERANGTSYREHILTLPREFNLEQNLSLIDEWIQKEIPNQPYSFAIHNPKASDGKEQPHCHLMFSERLDDGIQRTPEQYFKRYNSKNPEKGGVKKINTGLSPKERRENIKSLRANWGDCLNNHLARYNLNANIDMRNWKERGLSSPPNNKPLSHYKMEKRLQTNVESTLLQYILDDTALENRYPIISFDNKLLLELSEQQKLFETSRIAQAKLLDALIDKREEQERQARIELAELSAINAKNVYDDIMFHCFGQYRMFDDAKKENNMVRCHNAVVNYAQVLLDVTQNGGVATPNQTSSMNRSLTTLGDSRTGGLHEVTRDINNPNGYTSKKESYKNYMAVAYSYLHKVCEYAKSLNHAIDDRLTKCLQGTSYAELGQAMEDRNNAYHAQRRLSQLNANVNTMNLQNKKP